MRAAGVDVGSTQTKAVVMDEEKNILGRSLIDTGANVVKAAERAYGLALQDAGLAPEEVAYIVGTGYGRFKVTFGHAQISEISCHARGAKFIFPGTHTVVDIGGQDSKAIKVGEEGEVIDFSMNDKCAAGTGRFLAMAAYYMNLPLEEIGARSLRSEKPVKITTTCTVFVESEIMSHLARGRKVDDILKGMHHAIATRNISLMTRVGIEEQVAFTGGVTRNIGMVRSLEEGLEMSVNISPESHYIGAIGASIFSLERALAGAVKQEAK
ncbi:MAG: acyl-CoA dehydratase activase [Candidatus Binatia bacterium]|jgi:predicted CoA-substrate-specific enzyme activase|nr:acyl-CoA dehydratase activase [Candidatus Binatia bacterium]